MHKSLGNKWTQCPGDLPLPVIAEPHFDRFLPLDFEQGLPIVRAGSETWCSLIIMAVFIESNCRYKGGCCHRSVMSKKSNTKVQRECLLMHVHVMSTGIDYYIVLVEQLWSCRKTETLFSISVLEGNLHYFSKHVYSLMYLLDRLGARFAPTVVIKAFRLCSVSARYLSSFAVYLR